MTRKLVLLLLLLSLSYGIAPIAWATDRLEMTVSGVNDDVRKNILNRLRTEEQAYGNKLSDEEIKEIYQGAPAIIRQALEPFGYFKPKIESHLEQKDSLWFASFSIQPGTQIKITQVTVNILGPGKDNPVLQQAVKNISIKPGDIFKIQDYEKTKEDLLQAANNEGYIKSYLEKKEIRIDPQEETVHINLTLNTGIQYYLGEITFSENPFETKFLKRFIPFHRDEPFSSQKLLEFQQALSNSHYFRKVIVTPDFKHIKNNYVPINVHLTVPKSKQVSIGIGYGTVTGTRFIARSDFRRVTSTGHHLSTELNLSSIIRKFSAKYFIPGKKPLTDQYTLGGNIQKFSPGNGNSFSETFSAGYQKKHKEWRNSISLNFLNEQYDIAGEPSKHGQLLYPSLNLIRVKADDLYNPTEGSALNLTLQGASKQIVSATNFIQGEAKGKYIFSPYSIGRFILRGDLGYTIVNNLQNLPFSMQFFAGGTDSIRGYPDSKFGPGRYLETGSIEYQHKIVGDWSGAIFYDKGTASDHFGGPFNVGDGFGVIYQSFVGPLRLYVARAESRDGKPWSVELNFGTDLS